jgi:hypothetical protein
MFDWKTPDVVEIPCPVYIHSGAKKLGMGIRPSNHVINIKIPPPYTKSKTMKKMYTVEGCFVCFKIKNYLRLNACSQ